LLRFVFVSVYNKAAKWEVFITFNDKDGSNNVMASDLVLWRNCQYELRLMIARSI